MAKILIIDDSIVARMSLKSCLPKEGHEIAEAGDGASGIELFNSFKPDVTFLDLTMPTMDGSQALKEMKQIRPEGVIIVLTADIQKRTIDMVNDLGAYRVLKKPPQKTEVSETLNEVLASAGASHG